VEAGWRAVDPPGKSRELDLPALSVGAAARAERARVEEGKTRPPKAHTDATLLRAMETAGRTLDDEELKRAMRHAGLGTPATRADVLETLLVRKYVARSQREIHSTERGRALIDALPVRELKNAELTGRWEARLAQIAEARESRADFMADARSHTATIIGAIAQAEPPPAEVVAKEPTPVLGRCPICGTDVREGRAAYSCETGRACPFVIWKSIARRKVSARMVRQLLRDGKTEVVKGFRSKAGKPFEASLILKDGKATFDFPKTDRGTVPLPPVDPTGERCPKCGEGRLIRGRQAFGCDRWRAGCDYRVPFVA
jgi:DNA topoisomerase-3